MITIPTIPQYNRQVREQAMPNVRVRPVADANDFGYGVGTALKGLGKELEIQQDKQDTAAVISADNQLRQRMADALYNPDSGLMHVKGDGARNLPTMYSKAWEDNIKEITKNLNERQKAVFEQKVTGYKTSLDTHISEHVFRQNEISLKDGVAVSVGTAARVIPNIYQDKNTVQEHLNDIAIKTRAANPGRSEEVIKMLIQENQNKALINGLKTLYDKKDVEGSKAFLKLYGDKIDPDNAGRVQGWITGQETDLNARNKANELFSRFGVNNERDAMAELQKAYGSDPNFKTYSSALESKYVDERRYKEDARRNSYQTAIQGVLQANSLEEALQFSKNSNLEPTQQVDIERQAKARFDPKRTMTQDEKHWFNYEKYGGFFKHTETIRSYNDMLQRGDEPTEAQTKDFNYASWMVNQYANSSYYKNTYGTVTNQEPSNVGEFKTNESQSDGQSVLLEQIRKAFPDATEEEIQQFLSQKKGG